jgi:hypothetical protein
VICYTSRLLLCYILDIKQVSSWKIIISSIIFEELKYISGTDKTTLQITIFWHVTPCHPIDYSLNIHCCENFKFHIAWWSTTDVCWMKRGSFPWWATGPSLSHIQNDAAVTHPPAKWVLRDTFHSGWRSCSVGYHSIPPTAQECVKCFLHAPTHLHVLCLSAGVTLLLTCNMVY